MLTCFNVRIRIFYTKQKGITVCDPRQYNRFATLEIILSVHSPMQSNRLVREENQLAVVRARSH